MSASLRLGSVLIVAVVVLLLIEPVSGRTKHRCPRKESRFDRKLANCYRPLSKVHDPTAPHEYCRDYHRILKCVTQWVDRCKRRHWLRHKMDDMDKRVNDISHMIDRTC